LLKYILPKRNINSTRPAGLEICALGFMLCKRHPIFCHSSWGPNSTVAITTDPVCFFSPVWSCPYM